MKFNLIFGLVLGRLAVLKVSEILLKKYFSAGKQIQNNTKNLIDIEVRKVYFFSKVYFIVSK